MFYVRRLRFRLINYGKITNTEAKDHCHGVTQVSRTDRQTDRQTDGRTIDEVETLSLSSQGEKIFDSVNVLNFTYEFCIVYIL